MANPMQKAVLRRQSSYFAAIIVLLTLSLVLRGKESFRLPPFLADYGRVKDILEARRTKNPAVLQPATNSLHSVGDWLASRTILQQASRESLDLREIEQGDAEVDAAFIRLTLTGSRGLAVTYLWQVAQEYQKRNEFHKLEKTVNAVTRLQPNFTAPWLFQSWNIGYNVSVENDRLTDTYYYIARGIELLAKGERLNRDSPDMRYYLAFYYQNKFSVHDKVDTMRSLMQLSNIKPADRNPDRFRDPVTKKMDPSQMEEFRRFVREHPQLCRRLKENKHLNPNPDSPRYNKPEEIIRFLEENRSVPTRWDKDRDDALLGPHDQFPILPPQFPQGPDEVNPSMEPNDSFDAFHAARAWFTYATVMLPPPRRDPDDNNYSVADRFKYRIPKSPTMIIFRQGPQRAQTYLASDRLQKEGWFDADTRWYPDARANRSEEFWFEDKADGTLEALAANSNSREEWARAYRMWALHGEQNGLLFAPDRLIRYQELARGVPNDDSLQRYSDEQLKPLGWTREQIKARHILLAYDRNRMVTNFPYRLSESEAEQDPLTVKARQKLFDAEQVRSAGRGDPAAIRQYAQALSDWRQVLLRYKDFHRSDTPEEDTYQMQLNLTFMLEKSPEIVAQSRAVQQAMQALVPIAAEGVGQYSVQGDLAREIADRESNLRVACFDPRVQARVDQLFSTPMDDAALDKDWHVVLYWKRAVAAEAAARAGQAKTPAEREKAADQKQWREKAVGLFAEAATKPAWPELIAARDAVARQVVAKEFDWLPDYREPFKDESNRWFRAAAQRVIRQRLNLERPKGSAKGEAVAQ